jgi:hypothetical protein|tara:strand:- start:243 stop:1193 length:951 start_codon:yes stop_codon:yes gene_type:complete
MSKILNVNTGNYTVRVSNGNTITLDTGVNGTTTLTGNLTVSGTTTTVNSTNTDIKDNIIFLNKGETGGGITLNQAGIRIDRGTFADVQILYDETVTHNDPVTQTVDYGTFIFKDENNNIQGIYTNSIATGGGDLYLINSGTGVVSVSGTNAYENQITDDDDIPNKKYVDDAITTGVQTIQVNSIQRGDSTFTVKDSSLDGGVSRFQIKVDNNEVAIFRNDSTEIENLLFQDNTITTTTSGSDLTISSQGSPFVKIDSTLRMPVQDDSAVVASSATMIAIFGKDPDKGKTGVWFKNKYNHEDELISTNRSLLYSMLF